jgi:hypothetical protein
MAVGPTAGEGVESALATHGSQGVIPVILAGWPDDIADVMAAGFADAFDPTPAAIPEWVPIEDLHLDTPREWPGSVLLLERSGDGDGFATIGGAPAVDVNGQRRRLDELVFPLTSEQWETLTRGFPRNNIAIFVAAGNQPPFASAVIRNMRTA